MAAAGDLKARLKALKALATCKRVLCSTCHPALKGHGPGVFCNLQIPAAFVWVGVRATLVPGRHIDALTCPSRSRRVYSEALSDFSIFLCPECYAQALKDQELKAC